MGRRQIRGLWSHRKRSLVELTTCAMESLALLRRPHECCGDPTRARGATSVHTRTSSAGRGWPRTDGATDDVVEPGDRRGRSPRSPSSGAADVDARSPRPPRRSPAWGRTTPGAQREAARPRRRDRGQPRRAQDARDGTTSASRSRSSTSSSTSPSTTSASSPAPPAPWRPRPPASTSRTTPRCCGASRSAWSSASRRGTTRSTWPRGSSARRSPRATPSSSSRPSSPR